jgi:hypothetical protein
VRPKLSLSTRARVNRAVAAGAVVLLVAGFAGACTPNAGSAAVVGDTRFTVDDVQTDSREVIATVETAGAPAPDSAEVNRSQVSRLVTGELIRRLADQRGVTASPAEVDALVRDSLGGRTRDEFAEGLSLSELVPVSDFDAFAEVVLLNQKLVDTIAAESGAETANEALVEQLSALAEDVGVTVNPRFGEWDSETLSLGLPPNDLSTPAPVTADPEIVSGTDSLD